MKERRPGLVVLHQLDAVHRLDESREALESKVLLVKRAVDIQHSVFQRRAVGGAIDTVNNRWRTKQGKFLFPEKALAKVFRGKWFQAMKDQGWVVKANLPRKWVVDCEYVGNGEKALIYLGRYLYRGVLAEKNILACEHGQVTFRYTESSGATKTRTLAGADFLWLLLQHILPKGFRRTRDYGFLHGNCKRLIQRLHLLLPVCLPKAKEKPSLCCKQCGGVVTLTVIPYPRNRKPPDGPQATDREMPL